MRVRAVAALALASALLTAGCSGDKVGTIPTALPHLGQSDGISWPVHSITWPTSDTTSAPRDGEYEPVDQATKRFTICVSVPTIASAYYANIATGATVQAGGVGVIATRVAGPITTTSVQQAAFTKACAQKADALVLAPVIDAHTATAYSSLLASMHAAHKPVAVTSPGLTATGVTASSAPPTRIGSRQLGFWLNADANTKPGSVILLAGPKGSPAIEGLVSGLVSTLPGSSLTIAGIYYGPVGRAAQEQLLIRAMSEHPNANYIVGLAQPIEAAVDYFAYHSAPHAYTLASLTYNSAIARDIAAGKVGVAIDDRAVAQGAMALDAAVRILQGARVPAVQAPAPQLIDRTSITYADQTGSLAESIIVSKP